VNGNSPRSGTWGCFVVTGLFVLTGSVPAGVHTNALWPVIALPTIRVFISRVPSKE
jgi:hypothetical protein